MAANNGKLKPVFGPDGSVVGYLNDGSVTKHVIAYDDAFNFVGATATVKEARRLVISNSTAAARARLLRVGR